MVRKPKKQTTKYPKKRKSSLAEETYEAKDIYVLEGLEPVRRRPGMYIGSTGSEGLHHLIFETTDNSLDEAMAGYAKNIEVVLLPNNRVRVADDGRGIPVERHPQTKKSALETVMTTLHAGAKFGGKSYQVAGGLHGVGVSVVCALSKWMRAEVCRAGIRYAQEYAKGKAKTTVKKIGTCRQTGTVVEFEPDPEIFKEIKFDKRKILNHLRQQAYLTKGIRIKVTDERLKPSSEYTFYFEGGLASYVKYLTRGGKVRHPTIFYCSGEKDGILVEAAAQYLEEREPYEESFANNIYTGEGGTHLTGFRAALTRVLNDYAKKNNYLKEGEESMTGDDVREGIVAVVSVKIREPQFEGQTKAKLGNPEARIAVEAVLQDALLDYLERNPSDARVIIEGCLLAARARKAAKAARQTVLRRGALEGLALPGKLADCTSRDPAESELYIVEGESAGGSSRQARDRRFQAILPLRGKILNVERARLDKILASKEIRSLIIALGTAIAQDFDLSKLRYHRIIIMTDADSITGDTPIFLYDKKQQKFFLTRVDEFVEKCEDTFRYQILTYNLSQKSLELKDIYQTIKHPLRTPLYEIKTYCGYSIKVTSFHSVYVYENGEVVTKKGNEVKNDDLLIFPKAFPRQDREYVLDLKDTILNSGAKNISIRISQTDLKEIPDMSWCNLDLNSWMILQKQRELARVSRAKMGKSIGVYDRVIQQWEQKIDNVMPRLYQLHNYMRHLKISPESYKYDVYVPIDEWQGRYIPDKAKFYLGNHTHELKTSFKLDEDLAYLIGFFLGDGCATPEKNSPNRFSLSLGKEKVNCYIKELSRIIRDKLGSKPIIEKRRRGDILLHFHSFEFKMILQHLGILGKKCNEKFIPDIFFNVKENIQMALLRGLLESDGFITVWRGKDKRSVKAVYGWRVSSPKLIEGMLAILRQLGIFPAYTKSKTNEHLRADGEVIRSNFPSHDLLISTVEYILRTKNIWQHHKDAAKLEDYLKRVNLKKIIGKRIYPISGDFVGLKVREVRKIKNPKDKFVYDFSVVENQNFIAGPAGMLMHNTDGNHIRTLLLTLFYRYFQPIIEQGHLYIAQPPLYKIQTGKRVEYAYTEEDKAEILADIKQEKSKERRSKINKKEEPIEEKISGVTIQRYKGLGEMNANELWDTAMNPENRILLKVTIEDAREADRIFDILMGEDVLPRKKFIQTYAKKVRNLDI